ncbi:MAG TPA: acyltransferase [Coriobacteriia bacterium]|nr:acyltransferase [Coriobacteriia bacterium]
MSSVPGISAEAQAAIPSGDANPAAPKKRNLALDGLKYFAACSIVLHHVAARTGTPLGNFLVSAMVWALVFFFAVAGYLHGATGTRGAAWLKKRFVRLAIPYAFFSLVYLFIQQPAALARGNLVLPNIYRLVFFSGAHGIMWTLPVLFYCAVAAEVGARTPLWRRILLVVCVVLLCALDWSPRLQALTTTFGIQNFWYAPRWFAAYLAGMEFRAAGRMKRPPVPIQLLVPLSILGAGALRIYGAVLPPWLATSASTLMWATTVGVLLWGAAAEFSWWGADKLAWGGNFLIGIYLTHVIWLDLFQSKVPLTAMPDAAWIASAWLFCFVMATAATIALRSNRFTRMLVA